MSASSVMFTELPEERAHSTHRSGKALVFLAFVAGLGLGALLSNGTVPMTQSAIDMAMVNPMQTQSSQSMQPMKALPFKKIFMQPPRASTLPTPLSRRNDLVTANALRNPSAQSLVGSGVSQNRGTDLRNAFGWSPSQKCFNADKYASLCGDIVVLRPSTALRATAGEDKGSVDIDAEQILKDVSEKWDAVEDKTAFALYSGGAVIALVLTNTILSTVNAIPLIPGLLEVVGLGYSSWFAYRYLLKKSSREELVADIDELKKKISG